MSPECRFGEEHTFGEGFQGWEERWTVQQRESQSKTGRQENQGPGAWGMDGIRPYRSRDVWMAEDRLQLSEGSEEKEKTELLRDGKQKF